jgi:hypothetical protein
MPICRAPLAACAVALALGAATPALAAEAITLQAPNGLYTLALTGAPGGGFAIATQELVPYPGGTDPRVRVFRYEANGRLRWERVIDRHGPQIAHAITYGPGEILYVAGLDGSELTANSYQKSFIAFGPRGDVLEDKVMGDPAPVEDFFTGLGLLANGNLIAAGRWKDDPLRDAQLQVMELTTAGDVVWSDRVPAAGKESYPLVAAGKAGTFVAGTYENRRLYVKRVDLVNQRLVDFATFSTPLRCAVAQLAVLPDGGLVIGVNLSGGAVEARLVRLNASGSVVWDVKIPGHNTVISDLTRMPDGMIVVAGTSDDAKTLDAGAWLRAYDERGAAVGQITPERQGETRAGGVTVDGTDGVFFSYTPVDESIPARPQPVIVERIRVQ